MSSGSLQAEDMMNVSSQDVLDMVCIGFGPAGLTIAVALEDWLENTAASNGQGHFTGPRRPKVMFLEKQSSFNWHAGMLLHSAKMQISFIKDLATVRDPSSRFTFLNYLKVHGRLKEFSEFNTFLPTRLEFSDYLRWAASHFDPQVKYGHEVIGVQPVNRGSKVLHFKVNARDCSSGEIVSVFAKQVVIAAGGSPAKPLLFQSQHPAILHSSQYETTIDHLLPDRSKDYRVAVIGSGQSAAEIFDDLATRLPNAYTTLIFRDSALRPSDDSPFVNEVFDPAATDLFFNKPDPQRLSEITRNRATNYSVVRLELIEKIYGDLCLQDIQQPDLLRQRRRILPSTDVVQVEIGKTTEDARHKSGPSVRLTLRDRLNTNINHPQTFEFDAVILATGYTRNAHLDILRDCQYLSDNARPLEGEAHVGNANQPAWTVQRDYSVKLKSDNLGDGVGIWLQGCNEATHGLSDSLLSVLATRSGELVESMFSQDHGRAASARGQDMRSLSNDQPLRARL